MTEWRFLLDENIDPKTTSYLQTEAVDIKHVLDALGEGADDEDDILPFLRKTDRIIVTSDVSDFGAFSPDAHAGVVLLYDDTMAAHKIAAGLRAMIDAYGSRDRFVGWEQLDPWC
ncbi:DUF5615 family PIN-like protein [Halonotius sp. GCM10025705]|uniref:DUF5615 family PIN-like protein n=1 Tax=Halonotius sp. GCM10025705 TaxID=3252678 RepID=UPI00361BFE7D